MKPDTTLGAAPLLSVVIPVGPGEQAWTALLDDLDRLPDGSEIILVATAGGIPAGANVHAGPVRWIDAATGRARQLNAGVGVARHNLVWLLHADSRLPAQSLAQLLARPPQPDELVYFDLRFADGPALMWLNTLGTWLRSRVLRMPFGDQGFVLHRRALLRLGGFDPRLDSGEDHALVWRARHAGMRLRALGVPILTSARKYGRAGWWRTTLHHLRLSWRQARQFRRKDWR